MSGSEDTESSYTPHMPEATKPQSPADRGSVSVSHYTRTLPFEDMPGTGRNDAVRFGIQAAWGLAILGLSVLIWFTPRVVNANREEWDHIEPYPFAVFAVGSLIGALLLLGLAVYNLGQHLSHAYALQVAVARNLKQLEGFDTNAMKLHESTDLEVVDLGSSMWSDRRRSDTETQ